jgi:V-type H+-transporting ATPase subunit E
MTAFIKQEASEKAYEIEINADEEFAKEKSRLVREETASIDAVYAKKSKAAAMSQQITRSTVANKTRLRVLAARQGLLDGIFEEAAGRLGVLAREGRGYEEVLKNLMLEGFYALDEPEVVVRVRKADEEVAKKAIEAAEREYRKNMKKEVKASVDGEEYLPAGWYVLR